jgi:hypothetical protein
MERYRWLIGALVALALVAGGGAAGAQEAPHIKAREAWLARLKGDLTLTEQQVKDVRAVLETLKPGELAGGAAAGDGSAAAERRERSRQAIQKINDLLTPEQRTLWAKLREKRSQHGKAGAAPTPTPTPRD